MADSKRTSVKISGRVLYLTEDDDQLAAQLYGGEQLAYDPDRPLINNISTDELTPGWVCYYYDETLARYCLVGLRGGVVKRDAVKSGGFGVVVSGIWVAGGGVWGQGGCLGPPVSCAFGRFWTHMEGFCGFMCEIGKNAQITQICNLCT